MRITWLKLLSLFLSVSQSFSFKHGYETVPLGIPAENTGSSAETADVPESATVDSPSAQGGLGIPWPWPSANPAFSWSLDTWKNLGLKDFALTDQLTAAVDAKLQAAALNTLDCTDQVVPQADKTKSFWSNLGLQQPHIPKSFDWKLPKIEKIVVTEEVNLPKLELPKFEKGPVKEVPVYVYQMPAWPKIELPKVEPIKELPLVLYEMPPLPEVKPLPLPELRIEKHILPPPKFELPKIEPLKEVPLVLYEFPMPEVKLPEIEPIREIPIVMYELPPLPEPKPLQLPRIKMPAVKVVRKKLQPHPELQMPRVDLKLPEIKVVKYQMPETKPLELPKIPEVKFVKYEMPPIEKPKLPEIKPLKMADFKLPEFKLPEIKPLELPKLPEMKFPHFHPLVMPHMQYMYAPVAVPMPYSQPVQLDYNKLAYAKGGKLGAKKFKVQGSASDANVETPGLYPVPGQILPDAYGPQKIVLTGNSAILDGNEDEDLTQVFLADGNTGFELQSSPWPNGYSQVIDNDHLWTWMKEMYGIDVNEAPENSTDASEL